MKQPKIMTEVACYQLLEQWDFPIAAYQFFTATQTIEKIKLNYPLVLKVVASSLPHKSDYKGVSLNIDSFAKLQKELQEMKSFLQNNYPTVAIEGFLVQEMIQSGQEIILGLKKDPQFGNLILLGLGGVLVELVNDFVLRLLPIDEQEALRMIESLKYQEIFQGIRGQEKLNIKQLTALIKKLSDFSLKNPQIIELDLNPIFLNAKGIFIADALAYLEQ